jgi:hypothetical protein
VRDAELGMSSGARRCGSSHESESCVRDAELGTISGARRRCSSCESESCVRDVELRDELDVELVRTMTYAEKS